MSNSALLEALVKVDKNSKNILQVEKQYPGSIFNDICKIINNFSDDTTGIRDPHIVQCVTYALKSLSLFSKNKEYGVSDISIRILKITKSATNTAELTLVAATAWAKVVCQLHEDTLVTRAKLLEELENSMYDDFNKISLIDGILNCGYNNVIINEDFLLEIFYKIQHSCLLTSGYLFQSFQVFKTWSYRLKDLKLLVEHQESHFLANGKVISCANSIIYNNWENPVKGVPDLLENTFANILDFLEHVDSKNHQKFIGAIYEIHVKNVSWQFKGKYRTLNVLLPRIGVTQVLEKDKSFGMNLCQSLNSNHLVSVGVSVYKTILKYIGLDLWKHQFLQPLLLCLLDKENYLIQSNANIYWLPNSIKILPATGNVILGMLQNAEVSKEVWEAKLIVIKNQRLLGHINQLSAEHLAYVEEGLIHTMLDVRISAFSVLCLANKKGTLPSHNEMELIIKFIQENLMVNDAQFRQAMKSNFVQVMTRCRDFAVSTHRKLIKLANSKHRSDLIVNGENIHRTTLEKLMSQLNRIMEELFKNLFPGANYQRLITCLEFLNVLDSCFFNFEANKGINKGSSNGDPAQLMAYVSKNYNVLNLYSTKHHCEILLSCTLHYMEDVKYNAFELLKNFEEKYAGSENRILRKALELACSPKYGECESASMLFNLCLHWFNKPGKIWSDQLRSIKLGEQYAIITQAIGELSSEINIPRQSYLSLDLLQIYKKFIDRVSNSDGRELLEYAKLAPMHGILTSMRVCLPTELPSDKCTSLGPSFISCLIDMLSKSVDLMLMILSGGNNDPSCDKSASFADMGTAIDNLIEVSNTEYENSALDEDFSISDEHSLILACVWLNIKASLLMVAKIVTIYRLDYEDTLRCGQILTMVLTKCRHKGAMESAMYALESFCNALVTSSDPTKYNIPSKLLDQVLNDLDSAVDVSVTRRSAGLPMLVQKIVSAEPRGLGGQTRTLLPKAVRQLVSIASKPIIVINELYDMPQSHALHILKVLVHDSSLSFDIVQYCDEILICCVKHFSSESWSIRNASLQLFGGLVPRILGQKKTRNDDSLCNSMTVDEFFTRYPSLPKFLLHELLKESKGLVHPSLVPLLVLFSRMSLGVAKDSNETGCLLNEFKNAFRLTFFSSVDNVRKLAAKAYANFTSRGEVVPAIESYTDELRCVSEKNINYTDACLSCIKELLNLLKAEFPEQIIEHHIKLEKIAKDLEQCFIKTNCYIHRIKFLAICKLLDIPATGFTDISKGQLTVSEDHRRIHPGFKDLVLEIESQVNYTEPMPINMLKFESKEEFSKYISKLSSSTTSNDNVCRSIQILLEENMGSNFLTGKNMEKCNELLLQHRLAIQNDSELAMEILDLTNVYEARNLGRIGIMVKTTNLMVGAVCFASMMTQIDYKMFFSDESLYVSKFSQMSEEIEKISQPNKMETCRMHGAQCLKYLLPIFNARNIKTDFDPLVLYAFVKLVNTAFTLMSDEDNHVRQLVTEFVSDLITESHYPRDISTVTAFEKLTFYGLEQFSSCLEWFLPVSDVFFRSWVFASSSENRSDSPVEILKNVGVREYLFESGDGINVYAEEAGNNIHFSKLISRWLSDESTKSSQSLRTFNLNINVKFVIDQINSIIEYVDRDSSQKGFTSAHWTNQGFLMMVRYYNLLRMLKEFPCILSGCNEERKLEELEKELIVRQIHKIEQYLPLFCK